MNKTRLPLSMLALLLAGGLAVSACGGDDDDVAASTTSTTSTTLTAASLRTQANAVCTSFDADIGAVFQSLPDKPSRDEMQKAADDLARLVGRETDGLDALSPPAALAHDYDAMVAAARTGVATIKEQGPAFFESNANPLAEAERLAGALGLDACASGG
jgi:hypothetical protein